MRKADAIHCVCEHPYVQLSLDVSASAEGLRSDRQPPTTRYQGSKRRLAPWLRQTFADLDFDTALDAFGGTGTVSYVLKDLQKGVTFNDYLSANHQVGLALIENRHTRLAEHDLALILDADAKSDYDDVVTRNYDGVFYLRDENQWLDRIVQNISTLRSREKRAVAYSALFQACLAKRPYNLFHRSNLSVRTADCSRSFGNKTTWDTPFPELFLRYVHEYNAAVFDNGSQCHAIHGDVLAVEGSYDLVYVDPPYFNARKTSVNYGDFYHFLEGIVQYASWDERIDRTKKHRPFTTPRSSWNDITLIPRCIDALLERYRGSTIVLSYRDDGIPAIDELMRALKRHRRVVRKLLAPPRPYVLSTQRRTREVVLVAT